MTPTSAIHTAEQLTAILDSVPAGVILVDAQGVIRLANAQMERLFGWTRDELVGQPVELLVPRRSRAAHPAQRASYAANPRARPMGEGRDLFGLRKDGSEFPVEVGLNSIASEKGVFVVSAIVDISEREQTKALRQAVDALERSNIDLQRFAYAASHDLQTPMRAIAGFVGLLGAQYAEQLDDQGRDWIRRTLEATQHMQELVHDLLEYSRVDARPQRFERVPLDVVFDHALSLLQIPIAEAQAVVTRGALPIVLGDRAQLVQLVLELIGNGLKYRGSEPPHIHVDAERDGHEWRISVRDNGIGIEPRHHERIFEMFQRLHDQRTYPGTGIGLAVCRRVVLRHGGRIWVESTPGEGATFLFTLPASSQESS